MLEFHAILEHIFKAFLCRFTNIQRLIPLCITLICEQFIYCWYDISSFQRMSHKRTDVCLRTFLINKLIKIQTFWNILYYWLNNASCKNFKKKLNDLFVWVFFLFKSSQSTKNFMKIKVYGFTFCIADVDFTHVASYFIIGACCVVPVIHGITTEDVDAWTLLIVKSVRLSINEDVITIP